MLDAYIYNVTNGYGILYKPILVTYRLNVKGELEVNENEWDVKITA